MYYILSVVLAADAYYCVEGCAVRLHHVLHRPYSVHDRGVVIAAEYLAGVFIRQLAVCAQQVRQYLSRPYYLPLTGTGSKFLIRYPEVDAHALYYAVYLVGYMLGPCAWHHEVVHRVWVCDG